MTETVRTTCPYCGVGCGVLARPTAEGVDIAGDPDHPANHGRLCSKGSALGETVGLEGRLLNPQIRGRRVAWFKALDEVAAGFHQAIQDYGPDSVAFYVSGQLLTEDYYVANKLMKGFIGSANIDTNSRLCMSSAVAGHVRAFGEDVVPGNYEDLHRAELIVLVGSNMAWCHPIVFRRIREAQANGARLVVIDPRRTATAGEADIHLPIESGSDAVLFNGLLTFLESNGGIDYEYLEAHTQGFGAALKAARDSAGSIPRVAGQCGVREEDVAAFYRAFLRTDQVVTVFSQGINQSSSGTDKVNAIINCHLIGGRVGKPGSGPFSITGQPNAMGGREVGGLASTLAAHSGFDAADDVQRFWDSPVIAREPGLKAVDLFDAVADGRIRAIWIMATNPVVSLPNADRVRQALKDCPLVVVSDVTRNTDTATWADILLPAAAWGEKDGTVTNSERRISRQRPFREPPGEAKPDWWIIAQVADRLGFRQAFDYPGPAAIFDEHARLSALPRDRQPAFNIAGLAGLDRAAYDALAPVQWPYPEGALAGTDRLFADGRFATPDGRAALVAATPRRPAHERDEHYPLALNTGRVRDHWHTMTRTGLSPTLSAHIDEPIVAVHPRDCRRHGLTDGAMARLSTRWGTLVVRVEASTDQMPGSVFMPIHWSDQYASSARVGSLVNPAVCAVSGEPELKHTPANLEPAPMAWYGFLFTRGGVEAKPLDYWVRVTGQAFTRFELAGRERPADWSSWTRSLLGARDPDADWLEYQDSRAGRYRAAWLVNERMHACFFAAPTTELPARRWLSALFGREALNEAERTSLLMGRPADPAADSGPVVCSCFGVGRNTIVEAVREQGLASVEAVGECLQAGTNCGSCIPEIRGLLS
ncbi:molybdopterin-dependent oxidoreductase [Ectothiorhodospiraceae bacterium WFHF3C12]|nr:molybdopterin-dependent oxidoreductase [Ectothiorhodospiraceae bacterium WFHF3C12]